MLYDLKYDTRRDILNDHVIQCITWNLLGKNIETRKYPASWWDAFKERWYPRSLKKRYPVKYDTFKLYNICPHINYAFDKHPNIHLNWLKENHGFTPGGNTI